MQYIKKANIEKKSRAKIASKVFSSSNTASSVLPPIIGVRACGRSAPQTTEHQGGILDNLVFPDIQFIAIL